MKKIKIIISGSLLIGIATITRAQTPTMLNLKQCVETAIENNLQVRQTAYQAESDKVTYQQARANQLPYFGGSIYHGINQGRSIDPFTNSYVTQNINFASYDINTSVTLWNNSSIQNNIKQAELGYKASQMDWQQAKDNITILVILAYLQVLNAQEQLTISKNQVEVSRNQVSRLEILNNSGAIAPSLLHDLRGQFAGDELGVINAKNTLETAKINLAQLMNVGYNSQMRLEPLVIDAPVLYDGTADNIYTTAEQTLALVKAAEFRKQSAQKRVLAAKGQLWPTLSFNGGLGTNYSSLASTQQLIGSNDVTTKDYVNVGSSKYNVMSPQNNYQSQKISYGDQWKNNFSSALSIGIQVPILNGLQVKSRVKQAEIAEKRTNFEAQTVKTQLRQMVDQAYVNMGSAFERYQTLQRQVDDLNKSFKAAEVRFNAGVNTSVDYLVAKNAYDRANSNFVSAKYDYMLRSKILDFYQGKQLW
jgi:outer membrane protein